MINTLSPGETYDWRLLIHHFNVGADSSALDDLIAYTPCYSQNKKGVLFERLFIISMPSKLLRNWAPGQSAEPALYKSLLADLQDKPMTETYRYRVINVHGNEECARSNWITSTGNLRISPVFPGE